MPDLFDYRDTYPNAPGFKKTETSAAAAHDMKENAGTLRNKALTKLIEFGEFGLTADETADRMGVDILAIRPRFSELRNKGLIKDSGFRRANASGKSAIIWRAL